MIIEWMKEQYFPLNSNQVEQITLNINFWQQSKVIPWKNKIQSDRDRSTAA